MSAIFQHVQKVKILCHLHHDQLRAVFHVYERIRKAEREASMDEALSDMTQWVAGFADDTSGSGNENLDQYSEGWLADCLINDTEMHLNLDDLNPSGSTAVQIDLTELNNSEPEDGCGISQKLLTPTPKNIIFIALKFHFNYTTPDRARQEMLNTMTPVPSQHWPFVRSN